MKKINAMLPMGPTIQPACVKREIWTEEAVLYLCNK